MSEINDKTPVQAIFGVIFIFLLIIALIAGVIYAVIVYGLPMLSDSYYEEQVTAQSETEQLDKKNHAEQPVAPRPDLNLAFDRDQIDAVMKLSLTLHDVRHLKLQVSSVKTKTTLFIPAGLRAEPVSSAEELPAVIIHKARTISLEPNSQPRSIYLETAALDPTLFGNALSGRPYRFLTVRAQDPTVPFLNHTEKNNSKWNLIQTGVWILNSNASLKEMSSLRISTKNKQTGEIETGHITGSDEIAKVKTILEQINLRPSDYPLFKQIDAARKEFASQLSNKTPTADLLTILSSNQTAGFSGDNRIEQNLLNLASNHNNSEVRRLALECLMQIQLSWNDQRLLSTAKQKYDITSRFICAWTLYKKEHPAGLPLLSLYAEDDLLARYFKDELEKNIQKISGKTKEPTQTMLDYWTAAVGWEKLAETLPATELTGSDLADLNPNNLQELTKALGEITGPDKQKARSACHTLRRFPRSMKAFTALNKAALYNSDQSVRYAATSSLRMFRDFNPAPLCRQLIKNQNTERQLVFAAINLAVKSECSGYDDLLAAALRSNDPLIRKEALKNVGRIGITTLEDTCYKMTLYDADKSVKDEGLRTLAKLGSAKGLKLFDGIMKNEDQRQQFMAIENLRLYGDNTDALDILARYRDHPELGSRIKSHLARYGR